jgi:hypothetical protein
VNSTPPFGSVGSLCAQSFLPLLLSKPFHRHLWARPVSLMTMGSCGLFSAPCRRFINRSLPPAPLQLRSLCRPMGPTAWWSPACLPPVRSSSLASMAHRSRSIRLRPTRLRSFCDSTATAMSSGCAVRLRWSFCILPRSPHRPLAISMLPDSYQGTVFFDDGRCHVAVQ